MMAGEDNGTLHLPFRLYYGMHVGCIICREEASEGIVLPHQLSREGEEEQGRYADGRKRQSYHHEEGNRSCSCYAGDGHPSPEAWYDASGCEGHVICE